MSVMVARVAGGRRGEEDGRVNQSLSAQLLRAAYEVDCPECGYPIWVQGAEIVAQTTLRCPCCRLRIRLVDQDGRAQTLGADLERQLDQALKGLFR
jgi:DNA-directed RNA polymerase subunit RPC12/RpoP